MHGGVIGVTQSKNCQNVLTFGNNIFLLDGKLNYYVRFVPIQLITAMAFKCMTGRATEYLSHKFITRGNVSGRATWNSQQLNIHFVNVNRT